MRKIKKERDNGTLKVFVISLRNPARAVLITCPDPWMRVDTP
jgi:hypothetical protein